MYWLPGLFIVMEILLISYLDTLVRYTNVDFLYKKYKDEELKKYMKTEFPGAIGIGAVFAIYLIGVCVYFIVGLFYPFIWYVSVVLISFSIFEMIRSKIIKKEIPIEKRIKLARLNNFETSDIKFERALKLNELKHSEIKINEWKKYISPIIRIIIFLSIIILHYHFNLI